MWNSITRGCDFCKNPTWTQEALSARRPASTLHYNDVIMGTAASQITSLTIVYSTVYSDVDQRKHQSSASLALVRGIHRGPVNSPHKWPVTRKMFPFDGVIMVTHITALKRKCHFDEIFVTGCNWSCRFDNFRCRQWWKFLQNDFSDSMSDVTRTSCRLKSPETRRLHGSTACSKAPNLWGNLYMTDGFPTKGQQYAKIVSYHDVITIFYSRCFIYTFPSDASILTTTWDPSH